MIAPWNRDEEFVGLTPGLLPVPGSEVTVRKVPGGEWKGTVAPQFHPPRDVSPTLAGLIIDGKADPRDLAAMMVDLILRGHVLLEPEGDDFRLRAPQTPPEDRLTVAERTLAGALTYGGHPDGQLLSQAKRRLPDVLRHVKALVWREAEERAWFRGTLPIIGGKRRPRTATGTAIRVQTLGFERYLATAEAEQIKVDEAAHLFHRYLPYATAFGLAHRWGNVVGSVMRKAALEDAALVAVDVMSDPAMWILLDMLTDADAFAGLGEMLLGADGLFEGIGDVLGGIGDLVGDLDLGDLLDF